MAPNVGSSDGISVYSIIKLIMTDVYKFAIYRFVDLFMLFKMMAPICLFPIMEWRPMEGPLKQSVKINIKFGNFIIAEP